MSTTSYIYGNLSAGTISASTIVTSNLKLNSPGTGTSITALGIDSGGNVVSGASSGGAVSYWTSGSSGSYSVRVLNDSGTDAVGSYSYAEGYNTTSLSIGSHAEGNSTTAFGQASHAQGVVTIANGNYSFASGSGATASTIYSIAMGSNVLASGASEDNFVDVPIDIFSSCTITTSDPNNGEYAVVFAGNVYDEWNKYLNTYGSDFYLYNTGGQAIPYSTYFDLYYDAGTSSTYYVNTSITSDTYTSISGSTFISVNYPISTGAVAIGFNNVSTGSYAFSEGFSTTSTGSGSHSEGAYTTASGTTAHAEGLYSLAATNASHAEGFFTTALGIASHSEGRTTTAAGDYSHTQGYGTLAYENYSHAGGYLSIASGDTAFIHSKNSLVTGARSAVLGGQNITGTTADTVYVPNFVIKKVAAIPSGSTDSTVGEAGSITWDDTYFYFRTSTQWLRISGLTF